MFAKFIRKLIDLPCIAYKRKERVRSSICDFENFCSSRLHMNIVGNIQLRLEQHQLSMRLYTSESTPLTYIFEYPFTHGMLIDFGNQLIDKGYNVTPIVNRNSVFDEICGYRVTLPPNFKKRFAE